MVPQAAPGQPVPGQPGGPQPGRSEGGPPGPGKAVMAAARENSNSAWSSIRGRTACWYLPRPTKWPSSPMPLRSSTFPTPGQSPTAGKSHAGRTARRARRIGR
ncbi:MAG: hypothetical protein FJ295_07965 [Planctomycetes bacterium]|nr:hypothetical protein [Planctomycetota bacterium]